MSETSRPSMAPLVSADYLGGGSGFDEMWQTDAGGEPVIREHWRGLLNAFQQMGGKELENRRKEARRLFRENGVSYAAWSDGAGQMRPWELDPVPFVVPAADWARIEMGLAQRARLLDLILKDLYGPRYLIRNGMVPPELIYRHGGFLRQSDGAMPETGAALGMYAADVVRGSDGAFRVVADRTQTPTGAGLALETRIAGSRILPNLIRANHVHRLARFFRLLRTDLATRAAHQKLDPRIVVMAQGAGDPSYFDHAYLASYLGFPLVEGEDLTVREGHLWLRTIEGLKLVDVVLRRVPDALCDPLELEPDARAGIPGLMEVARRGAVGLVNPLGTSILENAALIPYLPRIARQFLGEDLRLESTPTWWCGDPASLSHVLDNLAGMVIKPVDRARAAIWGGGLTTEQREQWRARLLADPMAYVGQAPTMDTTTPSLVDGELRPRHALTRCFLAAQEDDYVAMPGGFTRTVSEGEIGSALSAGMRGSCKDTWVLASDEEKHLILWPSMATQPTVVGFESLPSRAAESLFWVGRYAERAEFLTRLARTALRKFNESRDYGDPADDGCLTILLQALRILTKGEKPPAGTLGTSQFVENTLLELVKDPNLPGSLAHTFKLLEDAAVSVRDRWSNDTWRVIDDLRECMEDQRRFSRGGLVALEDTLDRLVSALVAFTGLTGESTTHEHGWHFLMIGRRIERAVNLSNLLQATVLREAGEGVEHQLLESLLIANESVMTHRRRYRAALDIRTALQVLLLDAANPRSLTYQVLELEQHVQLLPRESDERGLAAEQRAVLEASTMMRLAQAAPLARTRSEHRRTELDAFLTRLDGHLEVAMAALNQTYFTHVQRTQQLVAVSLDSLSDDADSIVD